MSSAFLTRFRPSSGGPGAQRPYEEPRCLCAVRADDLYVLESSIAGAAALDALYQRHATSYGVSSSEGTVRGLSCPVVRLHSAVNSSNAYLEPTLKLLHI